MEILLTFFEGIASFISPCLLPLIPIYITFIVGNNDESNSTKLVRSLAFVLGFTFIFVLLGVFSSVIGTYVFIYKNYIDLIFGIFIVILGINYIGILKIKFLNQTKQFETKAKKSSMVTAFTFGLFFAVGYTPCVGAFLGAALMLASTSGSVLLGTLYLLSYSIGLGVPFVLSALFFEKIKFIHIYIKKNYKAINIVSGLFLIFIGLYKIFVSVGGLV